MKAPNLHKLGVFWANDGKKHPILAKLGAFWTKLVYWWVVNGDKIRYSESQNSEVRQAHPGTNFFEVPPGASTIHQVPMLYTLATNVLREVEMLKLFFSQNLRGHLKNDCTTAPILGLFVLTWMQFFMMNPNITIRDRSQTLVRGAWCKKYLSRKFFGAPLQTTKKFQGPPLCHENYGSTPLKSM